MCFANGRCLLCIAFLVLFAALLILAVVHRVRAKKKVLALTPGELSLIHISEPTSAGEEKSSCIDSRGTGAAAQ